MTDTPLGQFMPAERHHRANSQLRQSLAFADQPLAPALLTDGYIVNEAAAIEIRRSTQRLTAAFSDKLLELPYVARDHSGVQGYEVAITPESTLTKNLT